MTKVGALAALVLFAGCLEQGPPVYGEPSPVLDPTPTPPVSSTPAATPTMIATPSPETTLPTLRSLAGGQMAGTREEARRVFHDAASYQTFWSQVREDATQPAPAADFTAETVVAAVSDARPNACWGLRITNASASEVEVTTFRPSGDMMCASVISYPWHVVALSGAGRAVTFLDVEAAGPPPPS